jgi:hypothetical protein
MSYSFSTTEVLVAADHEAQFILHRCTPFASKLPFAFVQTLCEQAATLRDEIFKEQRNLLLESHQILNLLHAGIGDVAT